MNADISHFPKPYATRRSDQPTSGFYVIRLVKGGPVVGGEIRFAEGQWSAHIDGNWEGPSANPWCLPALATLHHYGEFSTESEVAYRMGAKRWAELHAPLSAAANPRRPLDLDKHIPF